MAFRACWIDRLHVVRWTGKPDRADVDKIIQLTQEGHERLKVKVDLLMILPPDIAEPDEGVRKLFADRMDKMLTFSTCVVTVVEGTGLTHSIRVSMMAGMTLLVRQKGLYVRNSLEDALIKKRPNDLNVDGAAVIKELGKRGFTTAPKTAAAGA
jgi:hypothetical protein